MLEYREFASAAMLTHDDGHKQFNYLSTRYEAVTEDSARFREAKEFCDYLLTRCACMKLYHWKDKSSQIQTLADIWDQLEHKHADFEPGTFAEYLRWVSTHCRQQRKISPIKFPPIREKVLTAGLLEPKS